MKRVSSALFAVAATALATSLAAQTPPPPSADQPTMRAGDKVTVTGCIERSKDSASPTGTTGAAGATLTKFVLANVSPSASATGTGGTAIIAKTYRLDGQDSELTPHVGHKVEITGTVAKEAGATGTAMSAGAPRLKIESVKMVADSCTP